MSLMSVSYHVDDVEELKMAKHLLTTDRIAIDFEFENKLVSIFIPANQYDLLIGKLMNTKLEEAK